VVYHNRIGIATVAKPFVKKPFIVWSLVLSEQADFKG